MNNYSNRDFHRRRGKKRTSDEARTRQFNHKSDVVNQIHAQEGVRGNLVLFYNSDEPTSSSSVINNAATRANLKVNFNTFTEESKKKFQFKINEEVIVEDFYESLSSAKKDLSERALANLKETCFSIIRKFHPRELQKIKLPETESGVASEYKSPKVGGIGEQMMMKMGWSGGGLGSKGQGTTNLVEAYFHVNRQGLGSSNIAQEVTKLLKEYLDARDFNPVAFSSDFTKDERALIHQIANKLNLRTRSYGKNSERFLVVDTKLRPWDIVNMLIDAGGENEQFKLVYPTKFPK